MKRKIRFKDPNGKIEIKELVVRDEEHLKAQIKFPHRIQESKKTYKRKQKHKTDYRNQF